MRSYFCHGSVEQSVLNVHVCILPFPCEVKEVVDSCKHFFSEILYTLARRILCRSCTPEYKAHTQQRFVQKQPSPKYTAVLSSAADPFEATAAPNNRQLLNITTLMMVMKVLDMIGSKKSKNLTGTRHRFDRRRTSCQQNIR